MEKHTLTPVPRLAEAEESNGVIDIYDHDGCGHC
jgi:hypothetical protein